MGFPEVVRSLRKKSDMTQEQVGDYLGVSFQAVSKWENGLAYPDTPLLPALANLFGVTLDHLFGIDRSLDDERIAGICREACGYRQSGDREKEEGVLREGLRTYPNSHLLINHLIYPLSIKDDPASREELRMRCGMLISDSADEEMRFDAIRILAMAHKGWGDMENARRIVRMLPELFFSRLTLEPEFLEGAEKGRITQRNLLICLEDVVGYLKHLADYKAGQGDFMGAIHCCDLAEALLKMFFANGDYFKFNMILMEVAVLRAAYRRDLGDTCGAACSMGTARGYAEAYDRLDEWVGEPSMCFDLYPVRVSEGYDKCGLREFHRLTAEKGLTLE